MGRDDEVAGVCGGAYAAAEWVLPVAMVYRGEGWMWRRQWSRGEKGEMLGCFLDLVADRASPRHFLAPPVPPLDPR